MKNGDVESRIVITPSLDHFEDEFVAALCECVNFGSYTETLSSRDETNRILLPIAGELPVDLSLENLINEKVNTDNNNDNIPISVNVLKEQCHGLLHACVQRCTDLLNQRDHLRKSYDQNHVYRIQLERVSKVTKDPNEIDHDLTRMKEELQEVEGMNKSNEVGVIRFEMGKILIKYKNELIDCIGKFSFLPLFVAYICVYMYMYIYIYERKVVEG